jgi:polyisoprenoid-binding protein YceI
MRLMLPLLMLCCVPATAAPVHYRIDPVHSRIAVAVEHAGFSQSMAMVSVSEGQLLWDPQDPTSARVDARIDLQRLDFGDARWNQAVLGRALLDVQRHPQARFHSTVVELLDDGQLRISGELELRGMRAPVTLTARHNGQRRHPMPPFRQTVGFSATATLSRAAFGADAWASMVGDTVQLRIELEATRSRAPDEQAPASDVPDPDADVPSPEITG